MWKIIGKYFGLWHFAENFNLQTLQNHVLGSKIDEFIRFYDKTRYLALFGDEKHDSIYNRIRYLKGEKSSITFGF